MATTLAVLALLIALAALALALSSRRAPTRRSGGADDSDLPQDARALRQEVAALRSEQGQAMRHVAVVRYDAFADTGGQLSWSLALLDDGGSGVVVTAIQGRNESRTYAKSITDWSSEAQLSPEEEDAISHARP